jgi:hypothetical protein
VTTGLHACGFGISLHLFLNGFGGQRPMHALLIPE